MRAILACDPKGGIGKDNGLPWERLEGDLKRFQKLTTGQTIVMGKNTWKSLPTKNHPLPNRKNVVFSRSAIARTPDVEQYGVLDQLPDGDDVWCIGGAQLFTELLPKITELHLSVTYSVYDCDTFVDLDQIYHNFEVISRTEHADHAYEVLERKK